MTKDVMADNQLALVDSKMGQVKQYILRRMAEESDELAERAGAAGRGDAGRGLVALRIGSVLEHFRLISTLIAAEGPQERLRGQARLNWLLHAARVLHWSGSDKPWHEPKGPCAWSLWHGRTCGSARDQRMRALWREHGGEPSRCAAL